MTFLEYNKDNDFGFGYPLLLTGSLHSFQETYFCTQEL